MQTRNGLPVVIDTFNKPGMSIFVVFGSLDGKPCHWTQTGRYRMDGIEDYRDIIPELKGN